MQQVYKRLLHIGQAEYWPGYTPDVILTLDFELWPQLALMFDSLRAAKEKERDEIAAFNREHGR